MFTIRYLLTLDALSCLTAQAAHPELMFNVWLCEVCYMVMFTIRYLVTIDALSCLTAQADHLKLMLSFAVGSLLGDVFCHLLPEVWLYMDRSEIALFSATQLSLLLCLLYLWVFFFY